jgi:hypothetical protein
LWHNRSPRTGQFELRINRDPKLEKRAAGELGGGEPGQFHHDNRVKVIGEGDAAVDRYGDRWRGQ